MSRPMAYAARDYLPNLMTGTCKTLLSCRDVSQTRAVATDAG